MYNFYSSPLFQEIIQRTGEHLILVIISMSVAIIIGIPLGIIISRYPKLAQPILGCANAIQTIPSLAIFGFLITVPLIGGIGKTPAIFALILYALLPIIRNTYTGIKQVNQGVKEAAKAMGMTQLQILILIELPLALKIILVGVRVSTVICVGIATIAAYIGAGGLGVFIVRGIAMVNNQLILAGAIPSAIIALGADWGIGWIEKYFTQYNKGKPKLKKQFLIISGIIGLLIFGCFAIINQQNLWKNKSVNTVIIGSKNYTEQLILGEILAQTIEKNTDLKVERKFSLGGASIIFEAVKSRQIDGYVELSGTAFTQILKQNPISNPQIVYEKVKQIYDKKFNLEVMPSLGFENKYAMMIRQEDSQKYNINTLSQAAKYTPQWQAAFDQVFMSREDGYRGLVKTYGIKFTNVPKTMEPSLMYSALANKQVDFISGYSTEGTLKLFNFKILEDDKKCFPPYELLPVFNQEILKKYPQLVPAIKQLAGQISREEMQQLNYQADTQKGTVRKLVQNFLIKKGLKS
ncbi:MAG TPA: glycine/betaine ABC transporter substrate-binding protein [Cyanothece sp. UBA12306]|nr:glycine/betaine ABC transporter substrate-binding protein [Cyanothece sp. UBA12306]